MPETQLPSSWEECQLGDVVNYGATQKAEPHEIPNDAWVLELEDIEKDTSKVLQRVTFTHRQSKSTKNRFTVGDILYGKLRPYLNKVVRADQDGYCTTEIVPLKPSEAIDGGYLFYWLKHPAFLEYVSSVSHGLNMPRLGTEAGKEAPFVLAPLNEQKRIADKLDAVFARVEACRERLDRVPAILKGFRQAVLAEAISGRLTEEWRINTQPPNARELIERIVANNRGRRGVRDSASTIDPADVDWEYPDSWVCETAASFLRKGVLADLKDGNHGANHPRVADFTRDGLPFITAAQVNNFRVDYESAYKLSGTPLERLRVGFARENDVVLTHKGSVGRVALVDRNCVLSPQTTYYRANMDVLLPTYLMYFLASTPFSKQLDAVKSQTTRDFVPISQQYGLWHLIPSLQEQHEIVRRIEALFAYAARLEARYTAARAGIERLTPTILTKAFRGELVPQDLNDEPAAVLLERIRAARAEQPTAKRRRKPLATRMPRAPREKAAMTKSRQDDDVLHKPYLAGLLRETGGIASVEDLFRRAELPVTDFYKQLAWEVENGYIRDDETRLEAA